MEVRQEILLQQKQALQQKITDLNEANGKQRQTPSSI